MIDISFEINGKKVRPNQIADELEKAVMQSVESEIRKMLSHLTSPSGQQLKITAKGKNLDNLSFTLEGPDELVEEARKALSD